jgi:hypothetical protein
MFFFNLEKGGEGNHLANDTTKDISMLTLGDPYRLSTSDNSVLQANNSGLVACTQSNQFRYLTKEKQSRCHFFFLLKKENVCFFARKIDRKIGTYISHTWWLRCWGQVRIEGPARRSDRIVLCWRGSFWSIWAWTWADRTLKNGLLYLILMVGGRCMHSGRRSLHTQPPGRQPGWYGDRG